MTARAGCPEEADDFLGYVLEKQVQGRRASIQHLLIDYMRDEWGKNYYQKRELLHSAPPLHEMIKYLKDIPKDEMRRDLIELVEKISKPEWKKEAKIKVAIVRLYLEYGMTLKEIGEIFGFHETRICQMMGEIQTTLKKYRRELE